MDIQKILQLIPNSVSGDGKTFVAALKNYLAKSDDATNKKIDDAIGDAKEKPNHVANITLMELHAVTDGVRSNNILINWDITPVEDYAKAEIWYKTDGNWSKAGEASQTQYVYQGAETGKTYYIRVVAVNKKGNAADFDTAPQASIKIKGSQYIPKAPTQFVLTWDEQGPLWQWLFEDNNYVDFFELRLDQNPGVWNDKRLDSTRETWSRADPGVRAGTAYLYIRNIFGEYSEPAVHQFNKALPKKPSKPEIVSTIDGVRIKMEALPLGCTGYKLHIKTVDSTETNDDYFETVNSEYIYFFFIGKITVSYCFMDTLGEGEWSDEATATVKAGIDIGQVPTIDYDKFSDAIKDAIDIANAQPDINKMTDNILADIENNIKNVAANITNIEGNIKDLDTNIADIENNITNIEGKIIDIDSVINGLDVDSVNSTLAELNKQMESNTSGIQQNADNIAAVVTRVTTVEGEVEKQGTAINQTAESITSLAKRVTTNEGKIDTNMSVINQTAESITSLVARVDNTDSNIDSLAQAVTDTATAIQQNADSITSIAKRVINTENGMEEHTSSIQQNADSITALVKRVTTAESGIEENTTAINQTADSITALAKRVTTNEGKISTNTSAIEQNAEGITALVTRVDGTEDTIEKQSTAIQQNADSITALAKRVTTTESGVADNTTAIQQNATSITALAKRVTTNEGKISTNTSAIEQNAEGITALVTRSDSTENDVNSLAQIVTTTATAVQQNADSITSIAKRVINTENGMEEHTSSIQQNADSITAVVKRVTTVEGTVKAQGTAINQTANSITALAERVTTNESKIDTNMSSVQQNADSIAAVVTRVTTVEGTVTAQGTAINQTAESITAVVTELNKDATDCNYSAISQLQDNILLSVKKDEVINAINISKEGIVIDGNKIHITGDTVFDNNVIVGGAIVADSIAMEHLKANSVSTAKIQANAITADKIEAGAITADKIETGAIEAKHLAANSVGADAIQAGSIIGDKIAANTITGSKLAAENIDLLGALAITGGNVKLSEEGLRLTGGDGSFTLFDSEGINYIDKSGIAYAQVKKMIIGKAYDGQYIKFAAPWAKPPTVLLSPMSIQVNDANYSTASLFLVCEATDVSANGFRVNNYLRLSSDSYNVVSIEKTDVPSSYTIEEMEQYWYGHYSYAYTFQCYSDVMKVAIPETAQYIEFSLQLTIVNPFSKTDSDSDTGRRYTYNSSISTNYPNANGGWTYLDNNKRTIIVQLIVGGKVLQEVTFTTSDTTASIVKNFLLSSSFNAGSTQAIIRVTWNYSLKTSEHGSWSTLYNGRDYIAKAACKCELKRTYYKFSASEAKIARGYAVFLVTDGSTNTYITETIVKVLIKYDEVPLSNATVLVSGITYTTSGDGYIEMSGSATTKYTFTYNAAPPIDAIVDFTDGVITTVNIAPADITCYIRVKYDDAIVANATVTINGEEKTTDSDGKVEISGLDKHSAEYTVSYKGDTTIITVNYVDGSITTAGLYSLQDGSKTWTWSEANNKVIDFTVPNGAHRIKAEAEVDFLEGVPAEENSASIKNASNNIVWGAGYSVTDDNGENYEHKDIESVIAVTPGKTYSLKFDCASTNGVTFSWGREIDKLTATVTDT